MVAVAREGASRRRRRRPEEARQEILNAAAELARTMPFHQVTISDVMRRTTLSRKSFYVHFRDRRELLIALLAPVRVELDEANAPWLERRPKGYASGVATLTTAAAVMQRHGCIIRAVAESAHYDPEIAEVWRDFVDPAVATHASRIRGDMERGRIPPLDPDRCAKALFSMNYAVLFDEVIDKPDADIAAVAETLATIWTRALYLETPALQSPLEGRSS